MNVSSTVLAALEKSVRVADNRLHRMELRRKKRTLEPREERQRSLEFIGRVFDCDAGAFLRELEDSPFRVEFTRRLARLGSDVPGYTADTSSLFDCETLYVVVRAAKPRAVVETGVLFGDILVPHPGSAVAQRRGKAGQLRHARAAWPQRAEGLSRARAVTIGAASGPR